MPSVRLISWSAPLWGAGDPRRLIVLAVKVSEGKVRRRCADKYLRGYPSVKAGEHLVKAIKYPSVLEHITFTFLIEGISRVTSHQLVRHRIASYTQESQRYAGAAPDYVIPPSIYGNEKARELYEHVMKEAWRAYNELLKLGIPQEDARYVIPQASTTTILMTVNLRELLHIAKLRLDPKAQWEIRRVVKMMIEEASTVIPEIYEMLEKWKE